MKTFTVVVIIEEVRTADGRMIAFGATSTKPPPLPLMWRQSDDHAEAVTVGRIEVITTARTQSGSELAEQRAGTVWASCRLDPDTPKQFRRLLRRGRLALAADMTNITAVRFGEQATFKEAELAAATLVDRDTAPWPETIIKRHWFKQ